MRMTARKDEHSNTRVAQWIEHRISNPLVAGSSPATRAKYQAFAMRRLFYYPETDMKRSKEDWQELIGCCVLAALAVGPFLFGLIWSIFFQNNL